MDCRGEERRKWIIDNYYVVPCAHIQLLMGQTKRSDAGAEIENDYYLFRATKKDSGESEIIQCGIGAARSFLSMLGISGLPLFNPLHGEANAGGNNGHVGGVNNQTWNPIAKQLYNAIMWVIVIIDANPETPIFTLKDEVYEYKDREPYNNKVKAVNTIISRTLGGRSLSEAINDLRVDNDIRGDVCQFDLLVNIINNYTDREGNCLEITPLF